MDTQFEVRDLTKKFKDVTALDDISLSVSSESVVGLIGKNGCGKTTLLRHIVGLYLPTSGECTTLGSPSDRLGPDELSRIGVVHQESNFLGWMKVDQQLRYVASFYEAWDRDLETRLLRELELDPSARVGTLSPGNAQKLGILLGVCHHPDLLLLDEPVSGLDPIAREQLLEFLLELLVQDANTIVISSHVLRDIERVVNQVVCMDRGRILTDTSLDDLQERFAEWTVTAADDGLPVRFEEDFVRAQEVNGKQAILLVDLAADELEAFKLRHDVEVSGRPVNLEKMFPLLLEEGS